MSYDRDNRSRLASHQPNSGNPVDSATVANVASAIAVAIGVVFALVQLRQARRERRHEAAVAIVATVQTQEVRQAVRDILALPLDVDPETIRSNPELLKAALAVDSACEMWGSMAFEGVIEPQMLDRMVGGWVRATWLRLSAWIEAERRDLGNPNVAEWWQWLVETLDRDPDPGKEIGAHIAYRHKRRSG